MANVVSLHNVRPAPRYDGVAFNSVDILESIEVDGFYEVILASEALSPLDAAPDSPVARNFTVTSAELEDGWYKVRFEDNAGNIWTTSPLKPSSTGSVDTYAWFTLADLRATYPRFTKLNEITEAEADGRIIPNAVRYVLGFVGWSYDVERYGDLLAVAQRIAVNQMLADDETIAIARARGQSSITVAGETINLDLTQGRNHWLSVADEALLTEIRGPDLSDLHTDKVAVRGDALYTQSLGSDSVDYIRDDSSRLPFWGN